MWTSNISKVYYSIVVEKYMKHFGMTGVRMNPEHPNLKTFILQFTTLIM